jgi:glycosyltransferase involved in cell wall biosynthesis
MTAPPTLSIIIPAYNEELRLQRSLERIGEYLANQPFSAEIIVVNDGSTDGTGRVVADFRKKYPAIREVLNERNRGKGYSVRRGMLEACGDLTLFTDADLSAPIEEADKLLAVLRDSDFDGAIGSRAVDRKAIEVHESGFRELAGIIFNRMVRLLVGVDFADTQCGFKAFRRERVRIVFEQQLTEGFGFDPEILFLARRHGLRIAEVSVRWAHDPATKVHMVRDSVKMFLDLLLIRLNSWTGRYPRQVAKRVPAAVASKRL